MPVIILVADGARPDELTEAMNRGDLPDLARLRAEGSYHTVTTVWPSVTGMAYTPFLQGRYPGPLGLPGLRWYDRSRRYGALMAHTRSYVGSGMRHVDDDNDPDAPTLFECTQGNLGALSVIQRGLAWKNREGFGARFTARAALTHFRGNVGGWLAIDRDIGSTIAQRFARERPEFAFCALTGIDKTSHAEGHASPLVLQAYGIVNDTVKRIRADAERAGTWQDTHVWIVSDHGHSPVTSHDDLALHFRSRGLKTLAHPWTFGSAHEIAVMVSGNAMAHLYVELSHRQRPFWGALRSRWSGFLQELLDRPSVDLAIVPLDSLGAEVHGRQGMARVERRADQFSYRPVTGDPLGLGGDVVAEGEEEALDVTSASDYPDALVQILGLVSCDRSGDILLSASRQWDFRERYEPIPHLSSHGALHREHMLVPLLTNHPVPGTPRRTVDIMPSVLDVLGKRLPDGLDGRSFASSLALRSTV